MLGTFVLLMDNAATPGSVFAKPERRRQMVCQFVMAKLADSVIFNGS